MHHGFLQCVGESGEVNIQQLTNKHKTLQDDIVSQRKKMTDCQTVIKRFKTDLHERLGEANSFEASFPAS